MMSMGQTSHTIKGPERERERATSRESFRESDIVIAVTSSVSANYHGESSGNQGILSDTNERKGILKAQCFGFRAESHTGKPWGARVR